MAGQNDLLVADLARRARFLDCLGDALSVELAGRPGRQHAHPLGVGHQQPAGQPAAFDFVGNAEVGDAEVGGHHQRAVGTGVVDRVDARLDLDRLLRVGVDVSPQHQQRVGAGLGEVIQHHKTGVLGDLLAGQRHLVKLTGRAFAGEGDDRITQRAEVLFQRQPADVSDGGQRLVEAAHAGVQHQVVDPEFGDIFGQLRQPVQALL